VPEGVLCQVAAVKYGVNVRGLSPNSMTFAMPRDYYGRFDEGSPAPLLKRYARRQRDHRVDEGSRYSTVEDFESHDLLVFKSKEPEWDAEAETWRVNLGHRVTEGSLRNFALVPDPEDPEMASEFGRHAYVRFGMVTKARYAFDFRSPLSVVQAFALCVTTFLDKLLAKS